MDFDDTPADAAWRAECGAWLQENLPRLDEVPKGPVARTKAWQAMKFDAGLAKITWSPEEGGRNGTDVQQIIFNQEQANHRTPPNLLQIGLDFITPTVRAHGTEEQRSRYMRPALRGEHIWCQMFSEPGAGSDVAGLSTSAVRDGDEWVINGQKVWTSFAQFADFGEVLCRTDPDAPKHRGITAFILDLTTPGVTIRPLRQMTGSADFNEIFLEDVRVPHANVIGGVDDGWQVAVTTLMNERRSIGSGGSRHPSSLPKRLAELARRNGTFDDGGPAADRRHPHPVRVVPLPEPPHAHRSAPRPATRSGGVRGKAGVDRVQRRRRQPRHDSARRIRNGRR